MFKYLVNKGDTKVMLKEGALWIMPGKSERVMASELGEASIAHMLGRGHLEVSDKPYDSDPTMGGLKFEVAKPPQGMSEDELKAMLNKPKSVAGVTSVALGQGEDITEAAEILGDTTVVEDKKTKTKKAS